VYCLTFTLIEAIVIKICFMLAVESPTRFVELASIASYKYIG